MALDFPVEGVELSLLLVVSDLERSRHFYRDVLGAREVREYGGTSAVLQFAGTWLLLAPWLVGYGNEGGAVGLSDTIAGLAIAALAIAGLSAASKRVSPGTQGPIGRIQR